MASICPSLPMYTCFMGLPFLLFSVHWHTVNFPSFSMLFLLHILCHPKLPFSQALPGRRAIHLVAIRPVNLRRYFSTPVRYVPVAKVNPQIGMASSSHKGFRENLHTARGSILPKKLAVSNLQPLMKPHERNKRR